jgi:sialate O-acetylesterase
MSAALSVSPIFRSNMVLQRNTAVPVFGTADAGANVTVAFQSQNKSATADAFGKWRVDLSSMTASASPGTMTVTSGSTTATFTGVQVGEVWLCSGQSNMGKPLSYANNSASYIADSANHNIRLFRMIAGNGPSSSSWQVSTATNADDFSAVGYWFGLDLSESLNIPLGLIQATHDGTSIDHWEHSSSGIGDDYDAMVKAIQPFAVKGVIWYQGESNGGDGAYQTKLTSMINEWRSDWGLAGLPFGIVQLPSTKWTTAELAQLNTTLNVANTWLVVTADLPGGNQLHPTEKYPIGMRLSIGARGSVYGENIEWSSPIRASYPTSMVSGNTVVISFTHTGLGLTTGNGGAPTAFEVAGSNGRYVSGTAMIVGNTVQVTGVTSPKHVRYGMSAVGNLVSSVNILTEGGTKSVTRLPASLFQLDFP